MTTADDIQKIYIAYFNRPADSAGLSFWKDKVDGGSASLSDLTNAFSGTEEYRNLYSGTSNSAIVEKVYRHRRCVGPCQNTTPWS
ncbi:DUF4214 domain-containing protein [Rhizobium sp. LjRoot30]|uniref:DUF4214 domain-containing protein n=1 Tax=Rhizobium sp. LjRoot30 TaxID=3342320 RepID=UPI003F505F8B